MNSYPEHTDKPKVVKYLPFIITVSLITVIMGCCYGLIWLWDNFPFIAAVFTLAVIVLTVCCFIKGLW